MSERPRQSPPPPPVNDGEGDTEEEEEEDTPPEWTEHTGGWKDVGAFSFYVEPGAQISYKGGAKLNDFIFKVDKSNFSEWGLQVRTKPFETEVGKKYKFVVEYTTDNEEANAFLTKLESRESLEASEYKSGTEIKGDPDSYGNTDYKLEYGLNAVEIPFTADAAVTNVFFSPRYVKVGTTFEFNKVELISVEGDASDDDPPADPGEPGGEGGDDGDDDDDEQSTDPEQNGEGDGDGE